MGLGRLEKTLTISFAYMVSKRRWVYNSVMKKMQNRYIDIKQNVRFGKPVVKGTRVAVAGILGLVEAGYRVDEIPGQYRNITLPMAKDAVN